METFWVALSAVGTLIAAIAAAVAAWKTWNSARANERVANYMRDQWDAETRARHDRLINLLHSVRLELVVVADSWEAQLKDDQEAFGFPRDLVVWSDARTEIAAAFPMIVRAVGKAVLVVEGIGLLHDMTWPVVQGATLSILTSWHSDKDLMNYSKGMRESKEGAIPVLRDAIAEIDKALAAGVMRAGELLHH